MSLCVCVHLRGSECRCVYYSAYLTLAFAHSRCVHLRASVLTCVSVFVGVLYRAGTTPGQREDIWWCGMTLAWCWYVKTVIYDLDVHRHSPGKSSVKRVCVGYWNWDIFRRVLPAEEIWLLARFKIQNFPTFLANFIENECFCRWCSNLKSWCVFVGV